MKTRTLIPIYIGILAIAIIGASLVISRAATTIGANVAWDPKSYTYDNPPPNPWNAEVWLKGGHKAQTEIDKSTIKLEGLYSPSATPYNALHGPKLVVPFLGNDVKAAIYAKLPGHMGVLTPGIYRLQLVITGKLLTGEDFMGDGVVTVTVLPPPPP
jgi:hypothetical protein